MYTYLVLYAYTVLHFWNTLYTYIYHVYEYKEIRSQKEIALLTLKVQEFWHS